MRPQILLLAYSISPIRGSEYSVGWNHVRNLAEFCDLTVLYGLAGPHMGDFEEIEEFQRAHGNMANVQFVPIRPNALARILNMPNRAGILVYSFYLAYRVWHWQAARQARDIIARKPIDLIHYLCPIGYREPGYLWSLGKPFIWGPVGGLPPALVLQKAPRPAAAVLKARLKNFVNGINLIFGRRVARALAMADTVVAASSENRDMLQARFGVAPLLIQENAIPDETVKAAGKSREGSLSAVRLIWIGSLDWRKSPDLLLDALAGVASNNWHLDVVGTGPLLAVIEARAHELGLEDRITFYGHITRSEVQKLFAQADLHLITSMSEGNPTVIWEAMAAGVPTLTIDHCGMHDVVCDKCGVRVPPTDYPGTRDRIAAEIGALIADRARLAALADGVVSCRLQYLWSKRSSRWLDIYRDTISRANRSL